MLYWSGLSFRLSCSWPDPLFSRKFSIVGSDLVGSLDLPVWPLCSSPESESDGFGLLLGMGLCVLVPRYFVVELVAEMSDRLLNVYLW